MKDNDALSSSLEDRFDQFEKSCPEKIVVPADGSPYALLPPEEIVLLRDRSLGGVAYKGAMNTKFRKFPKKAHSNGSNNGVESPSNK